MKKGVWLLFVFGIFLIGFFASVSAVQLNRTGIARESSLNLIHYSNFSRLNVSDTSLVLYLPFDVREDSDNFTYDYSNNLNNGSLIGGIFFNSSGGKYGGAYEFDGVDDYIDLGKPSSLNFSGRLNMTISAWVYSKGLDTYDSIVSDDQGSSASQVRFGFYYYVNALAVGIGNGTTSERVTSSSGLTNNQWYHVAVVINDTHATFYINGSQDGAPQTISLDLAEIPSLSSYNWVIGRGYRSNSYLWNGSIDDLMIFNRSLSSSEIQQIYNSTYPRFSPYGEMNFTNLNLSSGENITLEDCQTFNGSYIQGKLNTGNWKNFSNCRFDTSDSLGNLSYASLSLRFVSGSNFYSPIVFGPKSNYLNISNFASIANISFPPINYSDSCYGANCKSSSDPIGGFVDYSRIVTPEDASYYINTNSEFLDALSKAVSGDVIYINDSVTLNFTNFVQINVPNITIASGRGRNYSQGAKIISYGNRFDQPNTGLYLFNISAPFVRITGLRILGLDPFCDYGPWYQVYYSGRSDLVGSYPYILPTRTGIGISSPNAEVDNNEVSGWSSSAVVTLNGGLNAYIHNNYASGNCHMGLGYAFVVSSVNSTALIEENLFEHNKHSVASTQYLNSFETRYNIQLNLQDSSGHAFDRHGNGTYGGNYTIIHHNSFYSSANPENSSYPAISIRSPPNSTDGGQIYNNWFQNDSITTYLISTYDHNVQWIIPPGGPGSNVDIFSNLLNSSGNQYYLEPVAKAIADYYNVLVNQEINFDASRSYSNESSIRYVEWDFADNSSLSYGDSVTHSFSEPGRYLVKVKVSDQEGFLNWTYLNITVNPSDASKSYLDFWIYENSFVDSPNYVQKQAKVDGEILWRQNFSDNVSRWQHINVEIPSNLTSDKLANVTLGIATLKNYTDPLYPNTHEIEFFEVYFDQISILSGNNNSVGFKGDMENYNGWNSLNSGGDNWIQEFSWEKSISGDYSYRIYPIYRGNYTAGNFVGINQQFGVTKIQSGSSSETTPPTSSSSSGTPYGLTYKAKASDLQNGYSKLLKATQKIQVSYPDGKTNTYEIKSVNTEGKTVTVSYGGKDYSVALDDSVKIDSNSDGYYDTEISVKEVRINGYANVEFKLINEKIPSENKDSQNENVKDNSSGNEVPQEVKNNSWQIYVGIGLVVVLIWIWFWLRKRK